MQMGTQNGKTIARCRPIILHAKSDQNALPIKHKIPNETRVIEETPFC